ncbi:3-methyl-2-oxobutanoate hydroxymethyltransferase [Sulfuracidifex metallicus]|uniref:3-methyl-2-oxobutanoate hydroxymethyltransferase n=1 Tax=Sulfuracidifex metallicus DSM 6482 = JCM 9184 TaxID=523847 RepID=A0A6A9QJQ8_SULME|nr:3-methyl-2-oxobutanoate hydroxymethyltransferase [Sulfuracidifex metallicus]MUN29236.1 3-methyl-2-oxobutanoate hydroxymethyltransferase [Sulfuracidifex metallicus DSM 6482 = JCM 9184]WOE50247.1 3-methyl-2-oxobutanoate hydroxymethyltransferase [Sulfuracidifex metallicus DSM 6482 = JCM 9184]
MRKKVTIRDFLKKKGKEKITMLTAYDYPTSRIISETELDSILVGDSLGMVVLGYNNTQKVEMEDIIRHTSAVARANPPQLMVADMPFLSYEISVEEGIRNAGLLVKAGADAVKLEGGVEVVDVVKGITKAGIPVMGHIGMTPQKYLKLGGFRVMGKSEEEAELLVEDAKVLEKAGAFAVVIENTYADIAEKITKALNIPTICIGAGPSCDGQVLVIHDLLGFSETKPYFAKNYINLNEIIKNAVSQYSNDVKSGTFPSKENYKDRAN